MSAVWTYRLVEMVPDRIGQCSDSIVEDEQVLMLVLAKSKNQCVQNEAQVRHQLCTRLLLQGSERTAATEMVTEMFEWVLAEPSRRT